MKKVMVLLGGVCSERGVSLVSGKGVVEALISKGYDVVQHDFQTLENLIAALKKEQPHVVFNVLHGGAGENGQIPAVLDLLGVKYTHSNHTSSAIAMDKGLTKAVVHTLGYDVPAGFETSNPKSILEAKGDLLPCVIKPVSEGSSFGVHIVRTKEELEKLVPTLAPGKWIVEDYIAGTELTCSQIFDQTSTVTELRPKEGFYDYKAKYTDGMTDHILPAEVPDDIFRKCQEITRGVHKALGCWQVSRSDFRYDPKRGKIYFLEVNTHPGMTSLSLVPEHAQFAGISYADLCERLVEDAL